MYVKLLAKLQALQFRQRFAGEPVAMDVPVWSHMSQQPPLLACRQPLPECGCDVAHECHCLSPISAVALRFLGKLAHAA